MPLNKTGKKIMKSMKDQYGSKEGEQVFYASKNKGILPKVEKASMGKSFGPPPEKGPQPQGMNDGRLVEPKLKKRKRYDINPFLKIKRSEYSKTIKTDKGYTNVPSMYGGQEYNEDFLTKMYKNNKIDPETGRRVKTYKTPKEATVAAKRRSSRLKTGGITGCPHRENGVKSDIKGISDIQVKGKKFIGVK
jgi:hypothetical protein